MTPENFDRKLRSLKEQSPFRPFTVSLSGGARFEVKDADGLVFRNGGAVYLGTDGSLEIFSTIT